MYLTHIYLNLILKRFLTNYTFYLVMETLYVSNTYENLKRNRDITLSRIERIDKKIILSNNKNQSPIYLDKNSKVFTYLHLK